MDAMKGNIKIGIPVSKVNTMVGTAIINANQLIISMKGQSGNPSEAAISNQQAGNEIRIKITVCTINIFSFLLIV